MKTALKYLTILGLAIAALIWPSLKVSSTEGEEELDTGANVIAREAFRRLQLQDENGQIPPNALIDAYKQKQDMPFLPEAWAEFSESSVPAVAQGSEPGDLASVEPGVLEGKGPDPDVPSPDPWVSIGPNNISGRIRSIIIHPTATPATIWVGAVSGGVWKSIDDGDTWSTTTDFLANIGVHCMVIDPGNPDILYAGTGEVFRGNGVFKTIDGGTTWERLKNTVPSGIGEADNYWYFVNRLAICPTNPQLLLAATSEQTNYAGKIYRSTDAGETWSLAQIPAAALVRILDVRFQPHNGPAEPDDPAINCIAGTAGNGAYYSTDGGATWTTATGLPSNSGRVEVAYSRSAPSIVYASISGDNGQLYRSEDGGHSFHISNPAQAWSGSGAEDYKNCLWVDPVDPDRVLVGGTFLFRTTQGGFGVWQQASSDSIHVDHHMIVEAPGYNGVSNKTVYGVNDGGVYRTCNILAPFPVNWTSLNNTLVNTQFYGAAGNVVTGKIFGGTQDNGTLLKTSGSQNWASAGALGGDGYFCAVDQTTNPFFYGEFLFLQIYRSTTGGVSKDYIYDADPQHVLTDTRFSDLTGFYANAIAPFILDPNDTSGQTLLAGGRHLWRSTNAREPQPSWFKIKDPIQPSDSAKNISAIAVAPGNSNIIWVGHNDGSVYYTTNGTDPVPIWTPAYTGLPHGSARMCTRIAVGHESQGSRAVYATFAGFFPSQLDSKGNVWKALFSGTSNVTWTDIHHSLPSAPMYSLVISPFYPDRLYLGTEIGVFASSDGGDSWSPGRRGPANVPVFELFWMGPKLVAVTHGRGLFTLGPSDD